MQAAPAFQSPLEVYDTFDLMDQHSIKDPLVLLMCSHE